MTFVADENVDRPVIDRLRQDGHTVTAIAEVSSGVADPEVLRLATAAGVVLITGDTDFGELVFKAGQAAAGVVLLRLRGVSPTTKAAITSSAVQTHGEQMIGRFVVVEPGKVRVRSANP